MTTETVPVRTVNRQCSSGLQAIADVVAAIKAGFYDIGKLYTTFHVAYAGNRRTEFTFLEALYLA